MFGLPKIMLVDDNEDLLTLYSEVLRHDGFAVTVSENGLKALEIL